MTGQKIKSRLLLLVALCAVLTMIAWSQTWLTLSLSSGVVGDTPLSVTGQTMAPGLSALGLTSLALLAALALAGTVFRLILGVVQLGLGIGVTFTAVAAMNDPTSAAAPALIVITGIQDVPALKELVSAQMLTAWPFVSLGVGILTAVSGILILFLSRSWPRAGRKYASSTTTVDPSIAPLVATKEQAEVDSSHARIDAWDDLSRGGDPTS
ncbi:MAG: Trp biosynthesis-associated membrane protein [Actinomycetales bacterium]|nr:Trp biosynthesis-associated membrane protein [Actinomycetales bacterium]